MSKSQLQTCSSASVQLDVLLELTSMPHSQRRDPLFSCTVLSDTIQSSKEFDYYGKRRWSDRKIAIGNGMASNVIRINMLGLSGVS